jgi:hypothetical protein
MITDRAFRIFRTNPLFDVACHTGRDTANFLASHGTAEAYVALSVKRCVRSNQLRMNSTAQG